MAERIRVIQFGLGPIGCATARLVLERPGLELVGAVDIDPGKVGREASEIVGDDRARGLIIVESIKQIPDDARPDLVLHTTSSYFSMFKAQVLEILEAGLDIVSTSEELAFPWLAHPDEAVEIDRAAQAAGKTILGTGVNPGFLMDSLPVYLTAICQQVDRIEVQRVINASTRRGPFQAKIGSGLSVEAFKERMDAGKMGHVGLPESIGMVMDTLGKKLSSYESRVEPVIAEKPVQTEYFSVEPGGVIGLEQVASASTPEGEFIRLTFIAALDAKDEKDTIKIVGKPALEVTLRGTNGDLATVAIAVNGIAHHARYTACVMEIIAWKWKHCLRSSDCLLNVGIPFSPWKFQDDRRSKYNEESGII
jgi:hypothetical protein